MSKFSMKMKLEPISGSDWHDYPGAEQFVDKEASRPLYYNHIFMEHDVPTGDECSIIVDPTGVHFQCYIKEFSEEGHPENMAPAFYFPFQTNKIQAIVITKLLAEQINIVKDIRSIEGIIEL